MDQYSLTLPAGYDRRARMFDIGRGIYIACLALSVLFSIVETIIPLAAPEKWYSLWRNQGTLMSYVVFIPSFVGIVASIFFMLGDRRFRLFGIFICAAPVLSKVIYLLLPQIVAPQNHYLGYMLTVGIHALGMLMAELALYFVFAQTSLSRRLALIIFLSILSLGISEATQFNAYMNVNGYYGSGYSQVVAGTFGFLNYAGILVSILADILFLIFFCKVGSAKALCANLGDDEDWSLGSFFNDRIFAGAVGVILFLAAAFFVIIKFPVL